MEVTFKLVSDKYKYAIVVSPKSGCSVCRKAFISMHIDELSDKNDILEMGIDKAYHTDRWRHFRKTVPSSYKKIYVMRDKYSRACSMYFNRHHGIGLSNNQKPHIQPTTFRQFLKLVQSGGLRKDIHFRPQPRPPRDAKVIHVSELKETLRDYVGIPDELLEKFDFETKLQCPPKQVVDENLDLTDYNFKNDNLNLDILKNGVPQYSVMLKNNINHIIDTVF